MSDPLLLVAALILGAGLVTAAVWLLRPRGPAGDPAADQRMADLNARIQAMGELLARAQGQLQQTVHERLDAVSQNVHERLDAVSQNLGLSMQTTTKHTIENIQKLNERLAVIDHAQKNIAELSSQVTSLQHILSNKQSRGAFGQAQLESLVADVLPKGAYAFQHKLSNGKMPDCAIFLHDTGHLIVDAKFPLEAMTSLRDAVSEDDRKRAVARVKQDLGKHIDDIAERYFIPGETQDIALMFIPSESVYAELHERFEDVVQRAHRRRVMIVSPTLMVMAIQVIKQVRKDAQVREAVDQIRHEVGHIVKDVGLLGDRVRKLQTHFGQTTKDVDDILTSTSRIEKRAGRIEDLEFDDRQAIADDVMAPLLPHTIRAAE